MDYEEVYNWVTVGYKTRINIHRSKERITETNEIFTDLKNVMYALDLFPKERFIDSSISWCDGCAGEGVWLVGVMLKRMQAGLSHEDAIQNLRAVDIMEDNILAINIRLLCGREDLRHIVEQNIVCADALRYHYRFDGSYPYDDEVKAKQKEDLLNNLFE